MNDLSLRGQYQVASEFLFQIKELMRMRQQFPVLAQQLFCTRSLHGRLVTPLEDFREVIQADRTLAHLVLAWLTKNGPFLDDDRQENDDDYFECLGQDVTDQGLGEASRRLLTGQQVEAISFPNGGFNFSPVEVLHGLPEAPIANIHIPNLWDLDALQTRAANSAPPPVNWTQMLEQSRMRFNRLEFVPTCIDALGQEPFRSYVVERVFALCGVLDEFMSCRNEDGTYSVRNNELITQYFSGEKGWFSDESPTNKRDFKDEMSFPDPRHPHGKILCSWHGKIKSPQYRIHFEWPEDPHQKIRIFYIGPKITKN